MSWSWWPENSDGAEHEAWIQPIFSDGEEGAGSSCGEGIIQEERVDPDTLRVTYRRVRPYSEVDRLRMVCSCGWRGETVRISDMPAGHVDPRWAEPIDEGEARFLREWREHLAPLKAADEATCPTCGHRR